MTQNLPSAVHQDGVQTFADRVLADTSGFFVTVMAHLGDQLGLFRAMASRPPLTSAELAAKSGVQERYAREWLHVMASAGYLTYDPRTHRFALPPEHVPALAEELGPLFFGGVHQCAIGMVEPLEQLKRAFRDGGGVPQRAYGRNMWDGMERFTAGGFENLLIPEWIPAMPDVFAKLEAGCAVADVGCGRGRALIKLAQRFPRCSYRGFDSFEPVVAEATARAEEAEVSARVAFEARDAAKGLPATFDVITTFDVIHDAAEPRKILKSIRKALNPDGVYVCLEANTSEKPEENQGALGTFFYAVSVLYSMTTSLSAQGEGLGTCGMPESAVRELCRGAGFAKVHRVPLEIPFNILYEVRV